MKTADVIQKFNALDGRTVTVATLKNLHRLALNASDAGERSPKLRDIVTRLTTALKKLNAANIGTVKNLKVEKIALQAKAMDEKVNANFLHGLEHIQNDKEYSSGLAGISDTAYEVITKRILDLIKTKGLVWRAPWNKGKGKRLAKNHITKKPYAGVNFYLNYLDFSSDYFFTVNQINKLGGKVKKGEKGNPILYFKYLYKNTSTGKMTDAKVALDENKKLKKGYTEIPAVFYYNVFNEEQCEGLNIKREAVQTISEKEKIESAEKIVEDMPNKPVIRFKNGNRAYYSSNDEIVIPEINYFNQEQEYYSTLFHELIHSTGAKKRLGREMSGTFGSKKYAFEELIAELGASFLCAESGILFFTLKNSAAYIKSWTATLKAEMENDPKFFIRAASLARKASDYILATNDNKKLLDDRRTLQTKHREPTLSELSLTKGSIKNVYHLPSGGWTNTHILDFSTPKKIKKALDSIVQKKIAPVFKIEKQDEKNAIARALSSGVKELVFSHEEEKEGKKIFVYKAGKTAIGVNSAYVNYFKHYYPNALFYGTGATTPILVKQKNKARGIMMPVMLLNGVEELTLFSKKLSGIEIPTGGLKVGEITEKESKEFDVETGIIFLTKSKIKHIESDHKKELEKFGLTAIELVKKVCSDIQDIRHSSGNSIILIEKTKQFSCAIKLRRAKEYTVKTAYEIFDIEKLEKIKKSLRRGTTPSPPHSLSGEAHTDKNNKKDSMPAKSILQRDNTKKATSIPKSKSGILSAEQLTNISYKPVELGPYKKDFHRLNSDNQLMVWGSPGSGKTVYLLKLADYFASIGYETLYVANEEMGRSTLAEKIKQFNIGKSKKLSFTGDVPDSLKGYAIIFLDSVNSIGLTLDSYRKLVRANPGKMFILIVQSTKDGDFRGGKDWEHEVDVAGEIVNRKLILRKNRLDPDNAKKANKQHEQTAVQEAIKKAELRKAVKAMVRQAHQPKTEKV